MDVVGGWVWVDGCGECGGHGGHGGVVVVSLSFGLPFFQLNIY